MPANWWRYRREEDYNEEQATRFAEWAKQRRQPPVKPPYAWPDDDEDDGTQPPLGVRPRVPVTGPNAAQAFQQGAGRTLEAWKEALLEAGAGRPSAATGLELAGRLAAPALEWYGREVAEPAAGTALQGLRVVGEASPLLRDRMKPPLRPSLPRSLEEANTLRQEVGEEYRQWQEPFPGAKFGMEAVFDPLNAVPVTSLAKGAQAGARMAGRGLREVGKEATVRALERAPAFADEPLVREGAEAVAGQVAKEPWEMIKADYRAQAFAEMTAAPVEGGFKRQRVGNVEMQVPTQQGTSLRLPDEEHRLSVEGALKEGKAVPPEVLADYPDLVAVQRRVEVPPTSPPSAVPEPPTAPLAAQPAVPPTPPTAEPAAVGVPPASASPMVRAVEAMARGASDAELQDIRTGWRRRQQPEAVAVIEREIARRQAGAATSPGNAPEVATQPPGLPPSGAVPPTGVPPSPVEAPSPANVLPTAQPPAGAVAPTEGSVADALAQWYKEPFNPDAEPTPIERATMRVIRGMARSAGDDELQAMRTEWQQHGRPDAVAAIEREIAKRERAANPLLGNTAPQPPAGDRVMPLLNSNEQAIAAIKAGGRIKAGAQAAQQFPAVGGIIKSAEGLVDPWTAATSPLERANLVMQFLEDQRANIMRLAEMRARVGWEKARQAGIVINDDGRIVQGVRPRFAGMANAKGYALNDVLEHVDQYDMPKEFADFIRLGYRMEDETLAHARADGVNIRELRPEGGHHWSRVVEEVRGIKNEGRYRPEKARHYITQEEALEHGVRYLNDPVAQLMIGLDALLGRHIGRRMALYSRQELHGRTARELVDPDILTREEEAQKLRNLWGEFAQTVRAVRDGMSPTYDMGGRGKMQHVLRSQLAPISAEAKAKEPNLTSIPDMFPVIAQRIEDIRAMTDPLARRHEWDKLFKEAQARSREAVKEWQTARGQRAKAVQYFQDRPIAVEAKRFGLPDEGQVGVGTVPQLWTQGLYFPREEADYLRQRFQMQKGGAMDAINKMAALVRFGSTAFDWAWPNIQGLGAAAFHPKVWGQTVMEAARSTADPQHAAKWLTQEPLYAVAREMVENGMSLEGLEIVEALAKGHVIPEVTQRLGDLVGMVTRNEGAGRRASEFLRDQVVARGEAAFAGPAIVAKLLLAQGLLPMARRTGEVRELAMFLNNMTGTRSSLQAGIGPGQRAIESWLRFSPRMLRSTIALIGDAATGSFDPRQPGSIKAWEARKSLAGIGMAYLLSAMAMRQLSQLPNLPEWVQEVLPKQDITPTMFVPGEKDFASFTFAGRSVGFQTPLRSLMVLLARSLKAADRDPSVFLDLHDRRNNPLVNWAVSGAGPALTWLWDVAEGRDFLGEPVRDPRASFPVQAAQVAGYTAGRALPMWLQRPGEGESPAQQAIGTGLEFIGLRAIPASPATQRNELANQYAKERYGRPWEELDTEERQQISQGHPDLEQARATARETQTRRGNIVAQFWEDVEDERQQIRGETTALREQLAAGEIDGNAYRKAIGEREMQMAQVVRHKRSSPQYAEVPLTQGEKQKYYGAGYKPSDKPLDLYLEAYYALTELAEEPRTGQVDIERLFQLRDLLQTATDPEVVARAKNVINKNRDPDYVRAQEAMRRIMAIPRFGHQGVSGERSKQLADALGQYYAMQRSLRRQTGGGRISRGYVLSELSRQQGGEMAQLAAEALSRARRPNPERRALEQQYADLLDRFYSDLRVPEVVLEEEPELAGVQ